MRRLVSLALLLVALGAAPFAHAREWTNLGGNPLKDPYNPSIISGVIHRFTNVLPTDVASELAYKAAHERGRESTLCKGAVIAGMSFGRMEVWYGPVRVAWQNLSPPTTCKPITVWEATRGATVYAVFRVHACRNLGAFYPWRGTVSPPPSPGPVLGLIPPTECPPNGLIAACC